MRNYDHQSVEAKWQREWQRVGAHATKDDPSRRSCYILDFFPYPSGQGLHVGHPLGYTATDIIARKRRMEGWNVLHPMGWDAFGLPAENYAIKNGIPPAESTAKNITSFRRTLSSFGLSYDWDREIDTSAPSYYKWTQWLFLFLYKRGLAYKKKAPVNWCESDRTVLANEQVIDGCCERCKNPVVQKDLEQWFFTVTEYADRLLEGLDRIDWPERVKAMQRNWIGRSEGLEIAFRGVHDTGEFEVHVFTTRPDTVFGVSYVVLAPEHPLVAKLVARDRARDVAAYVEAARAKSELQRTGLDQEKAGVPLGVDVVNPFNGEHVPILVADYVLANYGTGAVMGVPAHDDRDMVFARRHGLRVRQVIAAAPGSTAPSFHHSDASAFTDPGTLVDSGEFSGLTSEEAKRHIADAAESGKFGRRQVNYHLRDWLISRQRYWGAPIPIIYCATCGEVPVPEKDLPVVLPDDVDFRPTGESPLQRSKAFHEVQCPNCGAKARRESDTMDTFVDSSWYFLRFASPHDADQAFDSHAVNLWCPVSIYVGGAEHAVLHLLYARFFTKALHEAGRLPFDEPFLSLRNQGLILGEDGQKMSKSRGNVIPADTVVEAYGADTLRVYEMFMGDFEEQKPWDTKGIVGVRRFLERVQALTHGFVHGGGSGATPDALDRLLHKTVRKVSADIEAFKFNTAVSALMILSNEWHSAGAAGKPFVSAFLRLLSPFAPHLADECWQTVGNAGMASMAEWPSFDPERVKDGRITLVIQVDGKVRDRVEVDAGMGEEDMKAAALASEKARQSIVGRSISRIVAAGGRIVNIVTETGRSS